MSFGDIWQQIIGFVAGVLMAVIPGLQVPPPIIAITSPSQSSTTSELVATSSSTQEVGSLQTSIEGSVKGPVELVITDPLGRKVGLDPVNNKYYDDTQGSAYFHDVPSAVEEGTTITAEDESKEFSLYQFVPGKYVFDVYGIGKGQWSIQSGVNGPYTYNPEEFQLNGSATLSSFQEFIENITSTGQDVTGAGPSTQTTSNVPGAQGVSTQAAPAGGTGGITITSMNGSPTPIDMSIPASVVTAADNWLISKVGQKSFDDNFKLSESVSLCSTTPGYDGGKEVCRVDYLNPMFESMTGSPVQVTELIVDTDGKLLSGSSPVPDCSGSNASSCQILITKDQATAIAQNNHFPTSDPHIAYSITGASKTGSGWAWFLSDWKPADASNSCSLVYEMEINANTGNAVMIQNGTTNCARL